jgi:hypothetical protein
MIPAPRMLLAHLTPARGKFEELNRQVPVER